jgi:drug/metabolite transporter (DMT)-like permease
MRTGNVAAMGTMLVAVGVFAVMDAGLKTLSVVYPAIEITALRAGASLPFMLASVFWHRAFGALAVERPLMYLGRALLGLLMLLSFIVSVRLQPLTESYAIFMSAPLMVALLSRLILGERVPRGRWIAIGVGLCGVFVAMRPSASGLLSIGGLAALTSAACYAFGVLMIRTIGRTDSAHAMVLWYMVIIFIGATALAIPGWQPIAPSHWPVIALIGLTGAIAQHFVTSAFRRAPASVVAPFEYTALPWGLLIDYGVFHNPPGSRVLLGGAIVILGGLYLVWDEHRAARRT